MLKNYHMYFTRILLSLSLAVASLPVLARQDAVQAASTPASGAAIVSRELVISTGATTVLIFPAAICESCVDRGHPDVSTSAVAGVSNVLRVKAASAEMPTTNLTVFTADGMIYSFAVRYDPNPGNFLHDFTALKSRGPAQFHAGRMNDADIAANALVVAATAPRRQRPITRSVGQIDMRLQNILLKDGIMFLSFGLHNRSQIAYDLDFSRFYIRDRSRRKRTSRMEKQSPPLHQLVSPGMSVLPGATATVVVAFPKFTIADSKLFCAEIFEKGGDRVLQLRMKGRHLLRANVF